MSNLKREASGTGTMGRERRAEARAWRWWVAAFSWARCVLWAFWNSVGETICFFVSTSDYFGRRFCCVLFGVLI